MTASNGTSTLGRAILAVAWLALPLASALALAGGDVRGAAAAPDPATEIRIEGFRFEPPVLEVDRGSTVRWVNADEEIHTVAFADGPASPALDTTAAFSRHFLAPGTYPYRCAIHPYMAGSIVVR